MRRYEEIKKDIKTTEQTLMNLNALQADSRLRISNLESAKENMLKNFNNDVDIAKKKALAEESRLIKEKHMAVFEAINQSKKDIEATFQDKLAKYSIDFFSQNYSEDIGCISSGTQLAKDIRDACVKAVGDELVEKLEANLSKVKLTLGTSDIEEYINKNKNVSINLNLIQSKLSFRLDSIVYNTLVKIGPHKSKTKLEGDKLKNAMISYCVLCTSLTCILLYFCSWGLFIGVLGIGSFNLYKSFKVRTLLYDSKILQDNANMILDKFKAYAKEDADTAATKLQKNRNVAIDKLDGKLTKAQHTMQMEIEQMQKNFKFDSTSIKKDLDVARKLKDRDILTIKKSMSSDGSQIQEETKKLKLLNEELEATIANLKDNCFSFAGTQTSYDGEYILAINQNDITLWNYPKESALFLYRGNSDFTSIFIRLFVAQTMSKLKPGACRLNIIDTLNLATQYRIFTKTTDDPTDKSTGCCEVVIDNDSFKEFTDTISAELKIRAADIFTECNNIEEYNALMDDVEGVRKEYIFILFDHFNFDFLETECAKQLLVQGADLGIYTLFFAEEKEVLENDGRFLAFLKTVERCYRLDDDDIQGITIESVIDLINSSKK